jgi:hypothetical protein
MGANVTTQTIQTKFGPAHRSSTCKDDWANMRTQTILGQQLHMQLSALRAYRQACKRFAHLSGWSPERIKRTGGRPILLTGSWRSCALQAQLHDQDPDRFASENGSLHPQGLAIDVSTIQHDFAKAHQALSDVGWKRARPDDEPWHHSWGFDA